MNKVVATVKAFVLGVSDGWVQPYSLSTSWNVSHLFESIGEDAALTWQDRGINIGQFLHAGFKSEAWQRGYFPFQTLK